MAGREVVIVESVRTPMGRRNGMFKDIHPNNLAVYVLKEVLRRAGVEAKQVDDVVFGCVMQVGEQALNIARNAVLQAGFPIEVPATTVDRQCGSSQQAIHFAANLIQSGTCDVTIAAGVESMSRVPMGSSIANGPGNPFTPELLAQYNLVSQGIAAELIAEQWRMSRQEVDEIGLRSQQRAAQATNEGLFKAEIVPVEVTREDGSKVLTDRDEGIRDTSLEKLATLKPSFKEDGMITAGNSSQITDGAAAVLLMEKEYALANGFKPKAKVISQVVVGVDPVTMLTGPIPGTRKVLERAGLQLADIDLIEINEAFASVVVAWARELKPDMEKVNVNGGAIALGHPLGASGARLMTTLLHELERRDGRFGLETMCCGGGIGTATIIDREI